MKVSYILLTLFLYLSSVAGPHTISPADVEPVKLMEFAKCNCEDEMSRLDYLAVQLQANPDSSAYIIVYGGRRGTRRGEVGVRAARMRRYLVRIRGIDSDRIAVFDGGFREELTVEFWRLERGEKPPAVTPTVDPGKVKFKKGKYDGWEEPGCFPDNLPVPRASHYRASQLTAR